MPTVFDARGKKLRNRQQQLDDVRAGDGGGMRWVTAKGASLMRLLYVAIRRDRSAKTATALRLQMYTHSIVRSLSSGEGIHFRPTCFFVPSSFSFLPLPFS